MRGPSLATTSLKVSTLNGARRVPEQTRTDGTLRSTDRRRLSLMPYYRAFNWFKTACIVHGVYARYRAGKKSTEGVDMDLLHTRIGIALDNADTMAADIL